MPPEIYRLQQEEFVEQPVVIYENRQQAYEDFASVLRTQGLNVNFEPLSQKKDKWGLLKVLGNSGKLVYELYGKPKAVEALEGCIAEYSRYAEMVSQAASKVPYADETLVLAGKTKQMIEQLQKGYLFSKFTGSDFQASLLVILLTKHL